MKKVILFLTVVFALWAAGCGRDAAVSYELEPTAERTPDTEGEAAGESREPAEEQGEEDESLSVFVYVCGAVQKPGVYELPAGSRVYEALEAAGGLMEEADEKSLNQAELLRDGSQITVYTKEEASSLPASAGETAGSGKVNLNTAGKELLTTLPGIGDAKADAILQYREENGGFSSIEEIMQIEGIKEKVFEKIRDLIEV